MKLAIIRRRYTPFGGAERFISQLAAGLAQMGVSVDILSEQWDAPANATQPPGLKVIPLACKGLTRTSRHRNFLRSAGLALSAGRYDLTQSHERMLGVDIYRLGDGVHAAWLDRLQSEAVTHQGLKGFLGLGKWRYQFDSYHREILRLEALMARETNLHYVANSKLVADELVCYYGVESSRIARIPNGVDTIAFSPVTAPDRLALREKLGLTTPGPVVLFVGSGFRRKGAFFLAQALARVPEFSAWIVGKDKETPALADLMAKQKITDRVHILGPRHDVRDLMQAADVFCLPSLYDPSPNAVLEALACGLPVLATQGIGTIDEILASGAGACVVREPESLAQTLKIFLGAEVRHRCGMAARQLAMDYDHQRVIELWMNFYAHQLKLRAG